MRRGENAIPLITRLTGPLASHIGEQARWGDFAGVIVGLAALGAALRVRLRCAICGQHERTVYLFPDQRGRYGRASERSGAYLANLRSHTFVCQFCKERLPRTRPRRTKGSAQ